MWPFKSLEQQLEIARRKSDVLLAELEYIHQRMNSGNKFPHYFIEEAKTLSGKLAGLANDAVRINAKIQDRKVRKGLSVAR